MTRSEWEKLINYRPAELWTECNCGTCSRVGIDEWGLYFCSSRHCWDIPDSTVLSTWVCNHFQGENQ